MSTDTTKDRREHLQQRAFVHLGVIAEPSRKKIFPAAAFHSLPSRLALDFTPGSHEPLVVTLRARRVRHGK